jgi:hypothetical protein
MCVVGPNPPKRGYGQSTAALPGTSDVDFLRDLKRVVDLKSEMPSAALTVSQRAHATGLDQFLDCRLYTIPKIVRVDGIELPATISVAGHKPFVAGVFELIGHRERL